MTQIKKIPYFIVLFFSFCLNSCQTDEIVIKQEYEQKRVIKKITEREVLNNEILVQKLSQLKPKKSKNQIE